MQLRFIFFPFPWIVWIKIFPSFLCENNPGKWAIVSCEKRQNGWAFLPLVADWLSNPYILCTYLFQRKKKLVSSELCVGRRVVLFSFGIETSNPLSFASKRVTWDGVFTANYGWKICILVIFRVHGCNTFCLKGMGRGFFAREFFVVFGLTVRKKTLEKCTIAHSMLVIGLESWKRHLLWWRLTPCAVNGQEMVKKINILPLKNVFHLIKILVTEMLIGLPFMIVLSHGTEFILNSVLMDGGGWSIVLHYLVGRSNNNWNIWQKKFRKQARKRRIFH